MVLSNTYLMRFFFAKIVNGSYLLTIFAEKASSQMFDRVLNAPVICLWSAFATFSMVVSITGRFPIAFRVIVFSRLPQYDNNCDNVPLRDRWGGLELNDFQIY